MVSRIESEVSFTAEIKEEFEIGHDSHGAPVSSWVSAVIERDGIEFSSFAGGFDDGGLSAALSVRAQELIPPCNQAEGEHCRMLADIEVDSNVDEIKLVLSCPRRIFEDRDAAVADEARCTEHHQAARTALVAEVGTRAYAYNEAKRVSENAARQLGRAAREL